MSEQTGGVEVDCNNALRILPGISQIMADNSPILWHKIVVLSSVTDRQAVLAAINKQISPLKLVPYFFHLEEGCITFLVSYCKEAIIALIRKGLIVPIDIGSNKKYLELALKLCFTRINITVSLHRILLARLDPEKKFADLSFLSRMPEVHRMLYDPSDMAHVLQQLVSLLPSVAPDLQSLSLAGNALPTLSCLNTIFTDCTLWSSLKVLDLSCNRISSIMERVTFHKKALLELYLDENPVCGQCEDFSLYIKALKFNFPNLIKLDGTYLHHTKGLPYWKQNFIHCGSRDNSGELADQFVEHFFTLYDAEDRSRLLRGLYHEDAYLSVCCTSLMGQTTSANARLSYYVACSRNLLNSTSKTRSNAALSRGVKSVLAKLAKMPETQHDPYSFTVDLLYNTGSSVVLTVTGVFRESNTAQKVSVRHFMRTFVLVAVGNRQYQIVNDILYVTNATSRQAEDAFRYTRPQDKVKELLREHQKTDSEKDAMVEAVSKLTDMRAEWSRKCLSDCDWDMKEALQVFVELYKVKQIPAEAFESYAPQQTAEVYLGAIQTFCAGQFLPVQCVQNIL